LSPVSPVNPGDPQERSDWMSEWSKRDRFSKLASILYPGNASETIRQEMGELAKNELKKPPSREAL
jgi:hypothetical protein